MNAKLSEVLNVATHIYPQDVAGSDVTSSYVPVGLYRKLLAIAGIEDVANTKVLTLQLKQAQDASGTGAKALGSAVTATSDASPNEDLEAIAEADVEDLDVAGGFTHVAVTLGTDDTGSNLGYAVLIRGNGRYSE